MPWTLPTFADFRARFARDFQFDPTGADTSKVVPNDYANAQADAAAQINPDLFGSQEDFTTAYLYLTAHFLVVNIRNSSQGLAGTVPWLPASKGVGPVSISYAVPTEVSSSPLYSMYSLSPYGLRYLMLLLPNLAGNVGVVAGGTVS